jgi:cytochrome c oxidase subunit II
MNGKHVVAGLGVIIVILVGVLVFYKPGTAPATPDTTGGSSDANQNQTATTTTSGDNGNNDGGTIGVTVSSTVGGTVTTGSTKEFTVTGSNFSFTPNTLAVKKGDTVKITFKNADGFHDFKLDEFNVATQRISGGSQATVTFVANKTGSFEYYCSVGTHRQMGMKGTLTVSE